MPLRRLLLLSSLLTALAGSACKTQMTAPLSSPNRPAAPPRRLIVLASAEIHGTPEPCGCTSDPLGDVARIVTALREAEREGGALLVDAGGLRYGTEPIAPAMRAQADLKAQFLEETWHKAGAVVGLGDEDLRQGVASLPAGTRLVANVTAPGFSPAPPRVVTVADVKVGIFALLGENLPVPKGVVVSEMIAAARHEVAELRGRGAAVIVALVHATRPEVRRVVRAVPGITLAVVGDNVADGGAAEQLGETLLVQPADEARRIARVDFFVTPEGRAGTTLFAGADDRSARLTRIAARLAQLGEQLVALGRDPEADPGFVAARKREQGLLKSEQETLKNAPLAPPPVPYVTARLIPVVRRLGRDAAVADALKALDARIGEANRKAGEAVPVPPAAPDAPRYVGIEVCSDCHRHEDNTTAWQKTVHARAWQTLVDVNKQWSFDCIKCHVTGYGERGGSAMAHVEGLINVQCESCHGPGSLHVARPKQVHMPLPAPGERKCQICHTPEHSDTFVFEAYLRDVLGPGHGAKRRAVLGDGPTGHTLRQAALQRAQQDQ